MEGIFLIHSINVIEKEIRKRRLLEDILSFPIACLKFDSMLDMELRTKCVLCEWPFLYTKAAKLYAIFRFPIVS